MRPRPARLCTSALLLASAAAAQRVPSLHAAIDGGAPAALAPVATNIAPDADPTRALGTVVTSAGNVTTIDGGTRAGGNLFHSFARFDLAAGDVARWTWSGGDPAGIANVINRVTGGDPSNIYGTLDSTALPNADFWFINPAGIVFGDNAQLNVPAAAHFSTAQELRFASGPAFAVTTPGGSTLSVAAPEAFGFLGGQGDIRLDNVGLDFMFLANGNGLDLAARDVTLLGSNLFGSGFRLTAVGNGAAEAALSGPPPGSGGSVLIDSSVLRLVGAADQASGIAIGGGHVTIRNISTLGSAFTPGPFTGVGGTITIRGDQIEIFSSLVSASTFGAEQAGDVSIQGGNVLIGFNTVVASETRSGSTGKAGRIDISGERVTLDASRVSTATQTAQPAGNLTIAAPHILMTGGAVVASTALPDATAAGGAILVTGGDLEMSDGSTISSTTLGQGDAGTIRILADTVRLGSSATIDTEADFDSSGNAGSIEIDAHDFTLDDASLVSSASSGTGRAGQIRIAADTILVDHRSGILSSALLQAAAAGSVDLVGKTIRIDNFSFVSSATFGSGAGGSVRIQADRLQVGNFSQILSSTFDAAPGGSILLDAGEIDLDLGADIASRSEETATGDGGNISVHADTLNMDRAADISSSAIGGGRAGTVTIDAGRFAMAGDSHVETTSSNAFPAGAITIDADTLSILGPSTSISSANQFDGGGDAGRITIAAGNLTISEGGIISTSSTAGAAGDIEIGMPSDGLLRLEGIGMPGIITTSSGPGTGGRITIAAPRAIISNGGSILALGERGGANVRIQTPFFISSADRPNLVAVNGSFLLEAQVGDVSRGTVERDLSVIDASSVLRGQCAAVRETGRVSELVVRPVGPYARPALPDPLRPDTCI